METRPMLFSAPMVLAILDGKKTQTRRIVKNTGFYAIEEKWHGKESARRELARIATQCPYGRRGDRLWVRETWGKTVEDTVCYRADEPDSIVSRWRPSIHMPRWASRITLEITGILVERLQEISRDDAIKEGVEWKTCPTYQSKESLAQQIHAKKIGMCAFPVLTIDYIGGYRKLWESINGPGSWNKNPWVWVIEFVRVDV